MASNYLAKGLKQSALAVALGLCFIGGVQAQTNAAGAVTGRAAAGDTITVTNPATGFSRTITVDSSGIYRFSQLPTGDYEVARNGGSTRSVRVTVGGATSVDFVAAGGGDATQLETVVAQGTGAINPIDVSSVESTTILTAQQIARIPVARNTTAVALLAPGTVRGDSAFGNLASFGGASVAENQYYLNGFNITNTFKNLNFAQVPFEAIAEQQIKTGGYGAEFGRSLGGVVNQITKRGTNEFHAGANVYWIPDGLRSERRSRYYANPLTPNDYGNVYDVNSADEADSWRTNIWASGALIQDRLFAYAMITYARSSSDSWGSLLSETNSHSSSRSPQWLLKLDFNISDNHLLEFTGFSDKSRGYTATYRNTPGQFDRLTYMGRSEDESGGNNYILKYTGYLTDNFTLSVLGGHSTYSRMNYLVSPNGTKVTYDGHFTVPVPGNAPNTACSIVTDARPGSRQAVTGPYTGCAVFNGMIDGVNNGDKRTQFRVDGEWSLGNHLLRFGYDADSYTSVAGSQYEGGYQWRYTSTSVGGVIQDRARLRYVAQGATVKVKQHAFYIEDSWSITDNFIAYIGLRWDTFENINGAGQTYVKINNQLGPRLGFSWDVNGDSSFKVFGNAGRYALPLTPTVAVRGASASLFTQQNFRPDPLNPNSLGGTTFVVDPVTGAPLNAVPTGGMIFINSEDGNPKTAATIASQNLKPMYQDEFILGFQRQLTDNLSMTMRGVYRNLKAAIDDNCDYTAVLNSPDSGFTFNGSWWYDANGNAAVLPNSGFPYCRLFNPGEDAVFMTDFLGNGQLKPVHVPGSLLSPKAKRTYSALETSFTYTTDHLFLQGSYTWSSSRGNTEGGVKSDIGQDDTNTTQDFDYYELTVNTYGYLPNDRRHSFKLFGNYKFNDEWSVGFNAVVQSGRPLNCFGVHDNNPLPPTYDANGNVVNYNYSPHAYGSSFMECSPTGDARMQNSVPVPRGTMGRLPWTHQFDLNVSYTPDWLKGLQFKVDIFNLFNSQQTTSVSETAEDPTGGLALPTYMLPLSTLTPRYVQLMVQYDF